jgi:hypothetical protein
MLHERHSAFQISSKNDSPINFAGPPTAFRSTSPKDRLEKAPQTIERFLILPGVPSPRQTALTMARDIGYLRPAEFGRLEALATETSKMLFGLLRKISQAADRPKTR